MNPLKKARLEKGLTSIQFATLAGVTGGRIRQLEAGEAPGLSASVKNALARLGYDPEKVDKEYRQWREERVRQVLEWAEKRTG